jgi:putative ABC transport system ATP-binding protein
VPESQVNLAVDRVSVQFGAGNTAIQALSDVSLDFEPGTLTLLMGPSGSGKTTLLSVLGCILTPDSGSVTVEQTKVAKLSEDEKSRLRRGCIGFIFQAFRLFHALSAMENVMISADISASRTDRTSAQAKALLNDFGLKNKLELKPAALSGGERQRVAIARALLMDPPIILADEPTASLDSKAGSQISEIMQSLAREQNRTVVVVSHDPRWMPYAERTIVLRDGCVVKGGNTN